MLWYWLSVALQKITWLFRPPDPRDVARIDPNQPCPVCAAREGRLLCIQASTKGKQTGQPMQEILCQHTCEECGAQWNEKPIFKVTPETVKAAAAKPVNPPAPVRGAF